ncbi:hypothetical protein [Trueperella sp. LYQ143]
MTTKGGEKMIGQIGALVGGLAAAANLLLQVWIYRREQKRDK